MQAEDGASGDAETLARLFRPRSVAVIGASADPGKLTGRPIAYLQKHRYAGRILPVNPRAETIAGLSCYSEIAALPEPPDVGLVLLGSDRVTEAVRQLAAAGCAAAIVLAGGFGEAGSEGESRQQELRVAAGAMRLLGPNTIGLVNITDRIMLSASNALACDEFPAGNVAVVSQSGGILGALLSRGIARGIGFSKLVATGNEADIDVSDVIDHLLDDPATGVLALYLEGLRKPDRFRAVADRAARLGKPIVAFKVGRSESGTRSAASHTGALAGADRVYDGLFRQHGVIRAESFSDLLDVPAMLTVGRRIAGRRLGIITATGGAATLIADAAGVAGFETPPPDAATAERLNGLAIRDAVLDRNPIDVTLAGSQSDIFRRVIAAVADSPSYDAVVTVIGSSGITQPDLVAGPLIEALSATDKPLVAYVSPEAPGIARRLTAAGIPGFMTPEGCAAALTALLRTSRGPAASDEAPLPASEVEVPELALSGPLNEAESRRLFAAFGIAGPRQCVAATSAEAAETAASLGDAVVLKVLSRHILHKTEVGGVALGVAPADVQRRADDMAVAVRRASPHPIEGFLVQEQLRGGAEMILGFARDPQLGPTILLGMGGVIAELMEDVSVRLPPLRRRDAEAMVEDLRGAALLRGFRGRPLADVDALVAAVLAFSAMVMALGPRLIEAEINPLFVLPRGEGVTAADGLVILS